VYSAGTRRTPENYQQADGSVAVLGALE